MKVTVRELQNNEFSRMEDMSKAERETMGNYTYVDNAWNYFWNTEGSFLCAEADGKIVGIAHLAILPDRAGWFEALRVIPEYQNQGVGKKLYEKAIELCKERYHCVSLSMYTGRKNVRSSGLAEKYGLTAVYDHHEYTYKVDVPGERGSFHCVDWRRAVQLAMPLQEKYGHFVSVNRTWYRINEENIRMMADKAYFYEDDEGNFVCTGTRFQHGVKLFVLMADGNYQKALDFAVNLAYSQNIPQVTCTFTAVNSELEEQLKEYGFEYSGEMITRERVF